LLYRIRTNSEPDRPSYDDESAVRVLGCQVHYNRRSLTCGFSYLDHSLASLGPHPSVSTIRPAIHSRAAIRSMPASEVLANAGESLAIEELPVDAVLMGRTTFEPALSADRWPWPNLDVFVLGSHRPSGTPDHVVVDSDPARLLARLRAANRGGDVHLVGGPRTIETFRRLGALDKLGLIVLPLLIGEGMRLTPSLGTDTRLTLESERALSGGSVEIVYAVSRRA
jgi:dihydrofolate reductase